MHLPVTFPFVNLLGDRCLSNRYILIVKKVNYKNNGVRLKMATFYEFVIRFTKHGLLN